MDNGPVGMIAGILVIIGGLNWGLVGVGNFINTNLNVVGLLLGGIAGGLLANIVYVLVGVSALYIGYLKFVAKK